MQLRRERIPVTELPGSQLSELASVTLSRGDVEAIDLALRLLIAESTPRNAYFLDVTRVRTKLAGLDGRPLWVAVETASAVGDPELAEA